MTVATDRPAAGPGGLTPLHPDLFVHRVPYRAMGLWIGRQLVVARLPGGGLWIHSPIPWTPDLRAEVDRLGEVRHVIGPNCFHDECLKEFQAEYPRATFHAAPGLAGQRRDIRFAPEPLSDAPHADCAPVFDQHLIRGMPRLNEVVFFHRASRSLIIADIAFHLGPGEHWLLSLIFRSDPAWGRFSPSRFCKFLMKDRAAVHRSIEHIAAWDFDRIVVGHGRNIETNAKAAWRDAFAFLG